MECTRSVELRTRERVLVPVTAICRERQPWHTRVHRCEQDVDRLARPIASTGEMVPIRVVRRGEGGYDYVCELLRLLAVEQLGYGMIPACVEEHTNEELLLRIALPGQEVRFPLRTIERGWALVRLQHLRAERGLPHRQTDLATALGLDEGGVSIALKAARAIPQERAEELARERGLASGEIATLGRDPVRRIARANGEETRRRLLVAAYSALVAGESVARAVREAEEVGVQEMEPTAPGRPARALRRLARDIARRIGRVLGWVRAFVVFWRRLGAA